MIQGVAEIREAYRSDRVAEDYVEERFREPIGALLHRRQADVLRHVIATRQPDRVLEIAPGPARLTVEVVPVLRRAPTLIDGSFQMLAQARRRLTAINGHATMIEGDAFQLPVATTFDLVYTFRLIRHFEDSDRARLYGEIARVLRPGGTLVFDAVNQAVSSQFRAQSDSGDHAHFDALLRPETLERELGHAGFRIVSLVGVQYRYSWLHRIQVLVTPRSRRIARAAMEVVDRLGGEPLEWVVVCQRA